MSFVNSLVACSNQHELETLLKAFDRNEIINSLIEFTSQFDSTEYLGQLSFHSDKTNSLINQFNSLKCCDFVKYFLMSLCGDPELHWRCSSNILPSLYWFYRAFAPKKTTIFKVNSLGVSLSRDFSVPLHRDYLYSISPESLPPDITSPDFLAHLCLAPYDYLSCQWSPQFVSNILFLNSYYTNLFPEQPSSFPSPYFQIYDFSVKRLLPSWGASMEQDQDILGPFLVCTILSSHKLTVRDSSNKLPSFLLSSPIANLINLK